MKNSKMFILPFMFLVLMNCTKDENSTSSIRLTLSSINQKSSKVSSNKTALNSNIVFTDFKISIRDVVFKNDDDVNSTLDTGEVQFRGPYQIDLLKNSDALSQTIGEAFVPDGVYKELRFKFHKDEDLPDSDNLFDKSIYISGTIDNVPFVFWHDTSENLDLGRSSGVLVQDGVVDFNVQFNISQFLNSLNQIDLSSAKDNNNNGVIEINPNDEDGNQNLAAQLKENIKMAADLLN